MNYCNQCGSAVEVGVPAGDNRERHICPACDTIHYSNRSGVRATCPDCHVPKEWIYKVARKIQGAMEEQTFLDGQNPNNKKIDAVVDSLRR